MTEAKVYKCRTCQFVGTTYHLRCPRCDSKEYSYYSQEVRRK